MFRLSFLLDVVISGRERKRECGCGQSKCKNRAASITHSQLPVLLGSHVHSSPPHFRKVIIWSCQPHSRPRSLRATKEKKLSWVFQRDFSTRFDIDCRLGLVFDKRAFYEPRSCGVCDARKRRGGSSSVAMKLQTFVQARLECKQIFNSFNYYLFSIKAR